MKLLEEIKGKIISKKEEIKQNLIERMPFKRDVIDKASRGMFLASNNEFANNNQSRIDPDFLSGLEELNFLGREQYFVDTMAMDSQALDNERKDNVSKYSNLLAKYKNLVNTFSTPFVWNGQTRKIIKVNDTVKGLSDKQVDDFGFSYDVNNPTYDEVYATINRYVNSFDNNEYKTGTFYVNPDTEKYLQNSIQELESMTPDDYRNRKLNRARFSKEELEHFKSDIMAYSKDFDFEDERLSSK